jgi:hypothetical protein
VGRASGLVVITYVERRPDCLPLAIAEHLSGPGGHVDPSFADSVDLDINGLGESLN